MKVFRRRRDEAQTSGRSLLEELERWLKRVLAIPLAAPLLLFMGFGVGRLTTRALALPGTSPVRPLGAVHEVPKLQIEALTRTMSAISVDGRQTENYVVLYRDHVAPVEHALNRHGVPRVAARRLAWPLVEHARRKGLDPATVASVMLVESEGRPHATSSVGARGLMQVMPGWAGQIRGCGRNLYSIDDNLCTGTGILAWYLRNADGDERAALLGYNGCVRGSNTPDCHSYPEKVQRLRRQIKADIDASRGRPVQLRPQGVGGR